MSDQSQGPGWWQASDGRWYPPESHPDHQAAPSGPWSEPAPGAVAPGGWGYGQPLQAPPQNDPLALWAMIVGIVGIPLICFCYIGVPLLIAAIPMGIVSRNRIRASNGALTGEGMALAGAICGAVGLVLVAVLLVFWGFLRFSV